MPPPQNSSPRPGRRWMLFALLGFFLTGLAAVVFLPIGWPLNRFVVWLYTQGRSLGLPAALEVYDTVLNMLLFAVPAALAALLWPRVRWWIWVVAAALASVGIELVQLLALPRDASVADVAANTVGAVLGAGAVALWRRGRDVPETGSDQSR